MKREKLWVVRAGDGVTLAEIVRHAGEGPEAITDGRVFVGKRRITRADHAVRAGDAVRIGPPARSETPATILFERDGLVACVKPAGIATVPDRAGAHSLLTVVAKAIGKRPEELRVTSRLDREVSGVVVLALDAGAEERLRTARAEGRYRRRYVAIAEERTPGGLAEAGSWTAPIGRAADPKLRRAHGEDAKEAMTRWRRIERAGRIVLLAVDPVTGRTHQIRVHASDAGAPLLGDRDYGGSGRLVKEDGGVVALGRIALHAARVTVPDADGGELVAEAPIPAELEKIWAELGGAAEAWNRAVSCDAVLPRPPVSEPRSSPAR